jgi:hypothetical protein
VSVLIITSLTSCGAKKQDILGASSFDVNQEDFASYSSVADGYTIYRPGDMKQMISTKLMDKDGNDYPIDKYKNLNMTYSGKVIRIDLLCS